MAGKDIAAEYAIIDFNTKDGKKNYAQEFGVNTPMANKPFKSLLQNTAEATYGFANNSIGMNFKIKPM